MIMHQLGYPGGSRLNTMRRMVQIVWNAIIVPQCGDSRPIIADRIGRLAMIPLSRSVFFGPMAVAIMGGLIASCGNFPRLGCRPCMPPGFREGDRSRTIAHPDALVSPIKALDCRAPRG